MKYRHICLLPLLCILLCGCFHHKSESEEYEESSKTAPAVMDLFAMDTYMNLKAWCDQAVVNEGVSLIKNLETILSVTNSDSDTSHINQSGGMPVHVSEDTLNLIQTAIQIGDESSGALDITVYPVLKEWGFTTQEYQIPDSDALANLLNYVDYTQIQLTDDTVVLPEGYQLDFGSLAKGYTSDRLVQLFRDHGVQSAIVNLGGNVQTLGRKPDGSLWTIGVTNPFSVSENLCTLQIENKAVITSGNYERFFTGEDGQNYWHIIDPSDGFPADNGLVSVTVIAESGLLCDALSTAFFVEGTDKAVEHWKNSDDFEMILVTDDGRIIISDALTDTFRNISSLPVEVISRE